jgi:hypothetical protein
VSTRTADWDDAPEAFLDAGPKTVVVRASHATTKGAAAARAA